MVQFPTASLSDLAEILPGAAISPGSDDEIVPVLLPRDVSATTPPLASLQRTNVPEGRRRERATLRAGDVVVVARGPAPRVGLVNDPTAGAVATANLLVLRATGRVAPTVLAAFLATPQGQLQLVGIQTGATTPAITVPALARLEVPVPPTAVQRDLAEFVQAAGELLAAEERALAVRRELVTRITERMFAGDSLAEFAGLELA